MKKRSLQAFVLAIAYVVSLIGVPLEAVATSFEPVYSATEQSEANTSSSDLYASFKEPADNMSSKPLFFWNTPIAEMTEEQLREIVRNSYVQSGYSGFGILPFWLDDYFTDRYFELYEAALDEGSKYGMEFSLYDENGFPSYTAGGLFAEKYPELTAKRLDMVESSVVEDGKIYMRIPQKQLLGAVAFNTVSNEIIDITDKAVLVDLPELDTATQPVGITASSEYGAGYEVDKAIDGDLTTRWNAADQSGSGEYIIINFGEKTKLDTVELFEDENAILHRVKKCSVQYWDAENENWVVLGSGTTIKSEGTTISFDAVTEQYYRIYFHQVDGGSVSINEINLYADGQKLAMPSAVTLNKEIGYFSSSAFSADYDAQKAFDNDSDTRWAASADADQWISAMFAKPVTIDSVQIHEVYDRIASFEIQYYDNGTWVKCAEGTTIGENFQLSFEPVITTGLRLYIHNAPGWASIVEFKMFSNGEQVVVNEMGYASSTDFSDAYNAEKAFDNDSGTRWAATADADQWISIMFGEKLTIDSVKIQEEYDRITSFEIQYYDNGTWVKCAEGTTVGKDFELSFAPVTTAGLRLYIHNAPGWASIAEFKAFSDGKQVVLGEEDEGEYKGSYIEYPVEGDGWKLMAFLCVTDGVPGMDYLSEEAVAGFINITYDEYYNRFKKYFDNGTITSAFYDEPSFRELADILTTWGVSGSRMWTDDFNEEFAEMYGEDINPVLYYPALWYDIGEKTTEARDKLNAVRTELFAKNYIGQVNQWCQDHGIELMGHMLAEDMDNPVPFHGDLMYCFKYQDCPTVDVIGHYGMTEDYYKIISSSAYNWDHSHVGVECYGAINNMPTDDLYKTAMDLYAKGINVMVPHAVWYDAESYWFQPELSYRTEPYASALPQYNEYIARLQTMLQEGRHVADIAVLYPIDTLEYDYNFNKNNELVSEYTNYIALTEQLSEKIRLDYTYIHPSVLDEKVTIEGATLHLNNQNYEDYKVMIIPSIRVISKSNLEKINAFYQNGGIVISVGDLPRMGTEEVDNAAVQALIQEMFGEAWDTAQAKNIERTNKNGGKIYHLTNLDSFETVLKEAYGKYDVNISSVSESNGHLTYIHKVTSGLNVYFFANSSDIAVAPTVTLRGEFEDLELWDPVTGKRSAIDTTVSYGKTTFTLPMDAVTSLFVVEGDGTAEDSSTDRVIITTKAWDFSDEVQLADFSLYQSGANAFTVADGMLKPTGTDGEMKAILKQLPDDYQSVSVDIIPGQSGLINGGLYLGVSDAQNEQDQINALSIGLESLYSEGDDANRLDLVVGSFPTWAEHLRVVSETGSNNALFTDGQKQPVNLCVTRDGELLRITVSLLSDPTRSITGYYKVSQDVDLTSGYIGLRSQRSDVMFDNFTVITEQKAVAAVGETGFFSVAEALAAADGRPVMICMDRDELIQIDTDAIIDLAGHTLSNVTVAQDATLTLIDSATDDYKGAYGSANVIGKVTTFSEVDGKNYMTVGENGVYSAHCYDVAITHISLKASRDALGYKAKVYGDAVVQSHVQSAGFNMWLDGGQVKTYTRTGTDVVTLRLQNVLACNGGEMNINATAFALFVVGEERYTKTCDQYATTMKKTLQIINDTWVNYTLTQRNAVKALCDKYYETVSDWALDRIYPIGTNGSVKESYDTLTGSFSVSTISGFAADGKLTAPNDGEGKVILEQTPAGNKTVSVDLYPNGSINSGIYLGASNAAKAQDSVNAVGVIVESNMADNPGRTDIVIGNFPQWQEYHRLVIEGENSLFPSGKKEPVNLKVEVNGNVITATVSLISDPSKSATTTYTYTGSYDLLNGQVGLRSQHNSCGFDNFTVNDVTYTFEDEASTQGLSFYHSVYDSGIQIRSNNTRMLHTSATFTEGTLGANVKTSGSHEAGIIFGANEDCSSYYIFRVLIPSQYVELVKVENGAQTVLDRGHHICAGTIDVRLEVVINNGTAYCYYLNNSEMIKCYSVTEVELFGDRMGLWASTTGTTFGNVTITPQKENRTAEVLIFGHSYTEMWTNYASYFPEYTSMANTGIGGTVAAHWEELADEIITYEPKLGIYNIGINDLNSGITPESAVESMERALLYIKTALPEFEVVLVAVNHCPSQGAIVDRISQMNALMRNLAASYDWMYYADAEYLFCTDKNDPFSADPSLFIDGLHPAPEGYALLADAIRSAVNAEIQS